MAGAWCDPNGRSGRVGNNATLRLPALLHGPVRAAFQPTAADQHVAALTGDIHLEPRQSITVKWTHVGLALCTVEFDVVAAMHVGVRRDRRAFPADAYRAGIFATHHHQHEKNITLLGLKIEKIATCAGGGPQD